jgi:type VI secretion system secreted protein VgrG
MNAGGFGQRLLAIAGSFPGGTFTVQRLNGREALSQCFAFDVDLLSDSPSFDISTLIGDTVAIAIDRGENDPRYIHGHVTRAALVGTFDRHARYSIHLAPWFFLLSGRVNNRIFQKKSVPTIAKALFREHGFADFDDQLSGDYPEREFVVQYRESDLAFVSRLLEKAGIYYFFRHEKGRHVLVLADSGSAHRTVPGSETIPFHPEGSPTPISGEQINRWEVAVQWRVDTVTSNDFDFERPKADLTARVKAQVPFKQAELEVFDYPAGASKQPQVDSFVRNRLTSLQADAETRHASGDVQGLGAGDLFTLSELPGEDRNKEYLVIDACFDAVNNAHDTGGGEGGFFHSAFTLIDSTRTYRPQTATPIPRIDGPQTAIVVGEDGEEITTDKYGRVKVQFPWDREGKHDQDSSCWVRVAQVWAGQGWGAMHIPRIGQEVMVEFLDGDPDRPIVTGRVYNADNMPPYTLPDHKTRSGIRSRSTKGAGPSNYNEIRFEDKKGSEELHIQAEKDHTTTVKHDRRADVTGDDSVVVGGDRSVTVTGNLSVTVKGGGKSANHSNLEVTGKHHVHASDTIEMEAPTHIQFKVGNSSLLIEPGKISLVSGGKAQLVLDASLLAQSSQGSQVLPDANALTRASTGGAVTVDASVKATSSGSSMVLVDHNSNVTIDGAKIQASGQSQVTISAGSGNIRADAGGVEIDGKTVQING